MNKITNEKESFYWKFREFIDEFKPSTENRKLFLSHLHKVERAIRQIEWVNSGESSLSKEDEAIMGCLKSEKPTNEEDGNIFPLTHWKKHVSHPSYGAIKGIVAKRKDNGAESFLLIVNGRHYINKRKFYEWLQKRSLERPTPTNPEKSTLKPLIRFKKSNI